MTEILFYHLQGRPIESALPSLLERCVERNWRTRVQMDSEQRLSQLDALLWTYREDSFLPHATETDPYAADQPILLTLSEGNVNKATVSFLINGAAVSSVEEFERIVLLFDGDDADAVAAARVQWADLAPAHECTYWQQDEGGRWIKKASSQSS